MKKPEFNVRLVDYKQVNSIEGGWTADDYQKLLGQLEFAPEDTTSEEQLRELCVMCLQDLEMVAAAKAVLQCRMGDQLSAGQIQSVSVEMSDEKMWEHFADQSLHERFFHVGNLMYAAFPGEMNEPDAVRLRVEITPKNQVASALLEKPLHESLVVRLLADGMDDSSILRRLFDEQLSGNPFPEADSIIWIINPVSTSDQETTIEVYSSCHWLDALKNASEFQSSAIPDTVSS